MAAVQYPSTLPTAQPGSYAGPRNLAQAQLEGPRSARRRFQDLAGATLQFTWAYSAAHMAIFRPWYEDTLLHGERWFTVSLPGPGGFSTRVARYETMEAQLLAGGDYVVNATLELRGAAQPVATA